LHGTVVEDSDQKLAVLAVDPHLGHPAPGVAQDVGERLLQDPVRRGIDLQWKAATVVDARLDIDPAGPDPSDQDIDICQPRRRAPRR
jgi:hypothetical protein